MRRIGRVRGVGWVVVLAGLTAAGSPDRLAPAGWPGPARVAVAVIVIELALLPVEVLAGRARAAVSGAAAAPGPTVATEVATVAGALVVVVPLVALAGRTAWWWVVAAAVGSVLLVLRARAGSPLSAIVGERPPGEVVDEVAAVAGLVGAQPPPVVVIHDDAPVAATEGLGRHRRLMLTSALLTLHPSLRRRVVAHEVAHHQRGHLSQQLAATAAGLWAGAAALAAVAADGRLWEWAGVDGPWRAEGLALVVLVTLAVGGAVRLPLAWLSRAHERLADLVAAAAVPWNEDPAPQRELFVRLGAELDPVAPERWWDPHPAPAERLAILRAVSDSLAPARDRAGGSRPSRGPGG
jgi:STE24 endopeptidase